MLNEDKIRLMTGIAMFEKKAQKDIFPVNRYFKSDYIGCHMIRSFLSYTFTCVICAGLWLLYSIEDILNTMDPAGLFAAARRLGILYILGLILYLAITRKIYSVRYDIASKSLKVYQAKLKRLEKKYEIQSGQRDNEEGKGR